MRNVFYTGEFRRDFKLAIKRGLDMSQIQKVMKDIEEEIPLDPKYKEHSLSGNYYGNMECHIQPDWLLVYELSDERVIFVRTSKIGNLTTRRFIA